MQQTMGPPLFTAETLELAPPSLSEDDALTGKVVLACEDNLAFMEGLHDGQMKLIVTSPSLQSGQGLRDQNFT